MQLCSFREKKNFCFFGKKKETIEEFTSSMTTLLESGLSVKEALEADCKACIKKESLSALLLERIKAGETFSEAVKKSGCFSHFYSAMLSVCEKTGNAEKVFRQMEKYLKMKKSLKEKIISALTYPLIVLTAATALCVMIVFYVFPMMQEMFEGTGTKGINSVKEGTAFVQNITEAFLITAAAVILCSLLLKAGAGKNTNIKRKSDLIKLNLPFIKKYVVLSESLNLSFAMHILTESGMSMKKALETSISGTENLFIKDALMRVSKGIIHGKNPSLEFGNEKILPDAFSRWLSIGEKSGRGNTVFLELKDYFEEKITRLFSKISSLIEPCLILFTGSFIMLIVMKIVLPLFSMYETAFQ